MTLDIAKKAKELIEKIEHIESCKKMFDIDNKRNLHFVIKEHYGDNPKEIDIPREYNSQFLCLLESIFEALNSEMEEL